jgi:hypothetical protein
MMRLSASVKLRCAEPCLHSAAVVCRHLVSWQRLGRRPTERRRVIVVGLCVVGPMRHRDAGHLGDGGFDLLLLLRLVLAPPSLLLRLCFQRRLELPDPLQATRRPSEIFGQLVAAPTLAVLRVLRRVDPLGRLEELRHLRRQLLLLGLHPLVAHRLVLGGVRLDLRPIERDDAQPDQTEPLTQPQHLHEQRRQRLQVDAPELADAAVVRVRIAGDHPKRDVFVRPLLDLARRRHADAVGIQ